MTSAYHFNSGCDMLRDPEHPVLRYRAEQTSGEDGRAIPKGIIT
jgi:hypothetical protein